MASTDAPLTQGPSVEARGYRICYTDPIVRSSLLRFTDAELLEQLARYRATRRAAEREFGRYSFEHGTARAAIALRCDLLAERGVQVPLS